jgi:hypothetical protein
MYPISAESASSAGKVHWAIVGVYAFLALFQ